MGYFPLFVDLSGKEVLVVGGGKDAERKAAVLLRFGAEIVSVSPEVTKGLERMASGGRIRLLLRRYREEDADGKTVIFSVSEDGELNRRIFRDASVRGIPVNVEDQPEQCTFYFPSLVCRDDFVVGITTSGSCPALSRYARGKIEELFPERFGTITAVLKKYRKMIRSEIADAERRRKLLREFLQAAVRLEPGGDSFPERLNDRLSKMYREISANKNSDDTNLY